MVDISQRDLTPYIDNNQLQFNIYGQQTNVPTLRIANKNFTGHLDLTRYPNLKVVDCSENKLTEITCNEDLDFLKCSDNQLTTIRLNNSRLISFSCDNNQLTTITCSLLAIYRIPMFCDLGNPNILTTKDSRLSLLLYERKRIREWYKKHPSDEFYDNLSLGAQIYFVLMQRRWIRHLWQPNSTIVKRLMDESQEVYNKEISV